MGRGGNNANPLDQISKDPLGAIANIATQGATFGYLGYNQGKFGEGATTRTADETLGEITGRNAQRDATYQNNLLVDAENAKKNQDILNEQAQAQVNDRAGSNAALAAQRTAALRTGANALTFNAMGTGSMERDFLGL